MKRPQEEPPISDCTRQRATSDTAAMLLSAAFTFSAPRSTCYCRVTVIRTKAPGHERLQRLGLLTLGVDESGGAQNPGIFVCPNNAVSKPWLGVGGSFTEATAVTLQKMSAKKQEEVLCAYFDKDVGIAYNFGRLHIGSCDFALGNWTCGDLVDGDMELHGFSIDRYRKGIIPLIWRAAQISCTSLTLLASPWSPPPWMKTTREFSGGGRLRPECRGAWALHYVRFVEEMALAGVHIWGVSVQNEPEAEQSWESCIYSAEEERDFVRDHLGPALEKAGLGAVKILAWDHNRDGMLERASVAYADPDAAKYIWGIGYHWYGDPRFEIWPDRATVPFEDRQQANAPTFELRGQSGFSNVRQVADLRPDKHILFTEGCQELGGRPLASMLGNWKLGERYAMNIIADVNAGCEGWIDWNLCLDEQGGPNHVSNFCVAPIICNTRTDEVLYQPIFWYLGHFSRYIRPGARRIICGSSRDSLETTAFINPDGDVAVIVMNQTAEEVEFWLKVAGSGAVCTEAPPHSITTFLVDCGDGVEATSAT